MFRSSEDEFLLCYDGMCFLPHFNISLTLNQQNLVFTSTSMEIHVVHLGLSNGKARLNVLLSIHLISFCSTRASLRFDMSRPEDWRKLSQETRFAAHGMGEALAFKPLRLR